MFIFASENELNDTIRFLRPDYPEQRLGEITNSCTYILNEVPVEIHPIPNGGEYMFMEYAHKVFNEVDAGKFNQWLKDKEAEEMKDAPV